MIPLQQLTAALHFPSLFNVDMNTFCHLSFIKSDDIHGYHT